MTKSFLGRGIGFPLGVDGAGGLAVSAHEQNIEESIQLVLGTAIGERLYRPTFGCRIHDFVFAPNNAHTRNLVGFHAKEALVKWEPRIRDIDVECKPDPDAPNTIELHISYMVRATNSHFNMVYPFFLRREEDL
ncbi:MAG: GPW/gp25 family protein [Myxococcales bacterium]|nr:GPW/gp25 family protein [Myxococcales bacterium]